MYMNKQVSATITIKPSTSASAGMGAAGTPSGLDHQDAYPAPLETVLGAEEAIHAHFQACWTL
jgi:hypothetical protein